MKPLPPPRPRRSAAAPAPIAGLSAEAMAGLTPRQVAARAAAARERSEALARQSAGRRLANRVAALPAPVEVQPKPQPQPQPKAAQPKRRALRLSLRRRAQFTPREVALLVRFADAYDAGEAVHIGLPPEDVAWAYRTGKRLRAQHQTF